MVTDSWDVINNTKFRKYIPADHKIWMQSTTIEYKGDKFYRNGTVNSRMPVDQYIYIYKILVTEQEFSPTSECGWENQP